MLQKTKKRFRVKTEFLHQPSEHRYFVTPAGAENHMIRRLTAPRTDRVFRVTLFDNEQRDEWDRLIHGGYVGSAGGLTNRRASLWRIAERLDSPALGELFGVEEWEWRKENGKS